MKKFNFYSFKDSSKNIYDRTRVRILKLERTPSTLNRNDKDLERLLMSNKDK